jgi:hypothetical protein
MFVNKHERRTLTELVCSYPVIYDLSQPMYMDSSFKTDIWNTTGKEMKVDGKYFIHTHIS